MQEVTITVDKYHEMFAKILDEYSTGLTHNALALAAKDTTGSHNVEAFGDCLMIDGEEYRAIESDGSKTDIMFKDITDPVEITYQHKPKPENYVEPQVAYIGSQHHRINMAHHPTDGLRRAKILDSREGKYGWEYLLAFFHDCLIIYLPQNQTEVWSVYSQSIKRIDKNGGKYN